MIGVYGANGFIGQHLTRRLARDGKAVRAVSRRFDESFVAGLARKVEFLQTNLNDPLAIAASLQDVDTVVQLISTSSPGLKNEHAIEDIEANVIPHVRFLQSCVQAGVRRYVFISSGGTVYGPGVETPTSENSPTNPICSHGITKLCIEKYIQMHGYVDGLDYIILRLANPFGPGQEFRKGQGLIPAVLDRYRKGLPVRVFGGGEARRDYVYIDDVTDAIESACTLESKSKLILNIGSGQARSVLEVLDAIESVAGIMLAREFVGSRRTDVDLSCLDIAAAKTALDWSPTTSFEEGIRRTISSSLRES